MISKEKFMPMEFFKKEAFKGSIKGMRYRVKKEEEGLEAVVYPEPFCFEATSEEKKIRKMFPFSEEGRQQVIDLSLIHILVVISMPMVLLYYLAGC